MLKTKEQIKSWLESFKIQYSTINSDLTVDVDGSVDLCDKELTYIPIQFRKVDGTFDVSLNKLTSLKGSPSICHGYFACYDNQLINLEGSPTFVGLSFDCSHNQLTSLKGAPAVIIQHFNCSNNSLTDLSFLPKQIGAYFVAYNNNLTNIENIAHLSPQKVDLSNNINLKDFSPLKKLGDLRLLKLDNCNLKSILDLDGIIITDTFYHATKHKQNMILGLECFYKSKETNEANSFSLEIDNVMFNSALEKARLEMQVNNKQESKKLKL